VPQPERVVVIGGDAAGMSAASQAQRVAARTGRSLGFVVLERGAHTSYSACGIPYWIGGEVASADDLVVRSPQRHRERGLDVRMGAEAVALDLAGCAVSVRDADGRTQWLGYDHLVLATGAEPKRPDLPGARAPGVHAIQTLDQGEALQRDLEDGAPRTAVVVGAGYIGVEMAEALSRRGLAVTVVEKAGEPMTTLDPDMGRLVHTAMEKLGIDVVTGVSVDGFETGRSGGRVSAVVAAGRTFPADVVVLGLGVAPATRLAADAGLPLGDSGGLRVDRRLAVPGHDGVWAAGDCVESFDRVSQTWLNVPLGTHANKQGRVLGTNLGGGYATFPGVVRTAVSRVFDLEIARTGLREKDARRAGFRYVVGLTEATSTAGYMPESAALTVKVLAEQGSGRLLGAQIVGGGPTAAKRIDTCAVAVACGMSATDLANADLGYAPPFSSVWDPIQIAARKAADRL
jgi:NADPH-dependent 2,4-dienoyl-CoA reductase/sulfur reductase-like enzyme